MELPNHSRLIVVVAGSASFEPAPRVRSRGTKWSAVGCATSTPGPLLR